MPAASAMHHQHQAGAPRRQRRANSGTRRQCVQPQHRRKTRWSAKTATTASGPCRCGPRASPPRASLTAMLTEESAMAAIEAEVASTDHALRARDGALRLRRRLAGTWRSRSCRSAGCWAVGGSQRLHLAPACAGRISHTTESIMAKKGRRGGGSRRSWTAAGGRRRRRRQAPDDLQRDDASAAAFSRSWIDPSKRRAQPPRPDHREHEPSDHDLRRRPPRVQRSGPDDHEEGDDEAARRVPSRSRSSSGLSR